MSGIYACSGVRSRYPLLISTTKNAPTSGAFFVVELKAAKTHTVIYKINGREFYCAVDLPLSDYPLYGKQLVARG